MPAPKLSKIQTDVTSLYQGWNTFAGASKAQAVDGLSTPGGSVKEVRYQRCDDTLSLFQALNIDTSISGSYDFLDAATAKMDFYKSLKTTLYSVSLVVYSRSAEMLRYEDLYWSKPKPTAATLDDFLAQYGDAWVSQIESGGEFIGAFVFYSESETERTSVNMTLEAAGIFEEGVVDAKFEEKFRTAVSSINKRKNYQAYLTGYKDKNLPGPDAMVRFALDLGKPDDPLPIRFKVEGYEVAGASTELFENVILNRQLFNGVAGRNGLGPNRAKLRSMQDQVKYIRDIYAAYAYAGDADFNEKTAQIERDVTALDETAAAMSRQPATIATAPELKSLGYGSPVPQWKWQQNDGWGGNGGTPFYDVPDTAVLSLRRLSILQGRGGAVVDCLISTYTSDDADPVTTRHGGNGGEETRTLTLGEGDRIVSLSGTYEEGDVIHSLEFVSNRDRLKIPQQGGEPGNKNFRFEIKEDCALLGFEGRSGTKLDHIAPRVVKFLPVVWKVGDDAPSANQAVLQVAKSRAPGRVFEPLQEVNDPSVFPFCYTGRVRSRFPAYTMDGSGVLVGSRHVITAAHNVYDRAAQTGAAQVAFWLQVNSPRSPVRYQEVTATFRFPNEYRDRDLTGDFCTRRNERESTWEEERSCLSRGTSPSRS